MKQDKSFLSVRQKIYLPFKRVVDIFLSFLAIVVFSPLYIVLAILVKCSSKGPIFFKQERRTKNGKVFKMLKFRSMVVNAEAIGTGLFNYENDPRVTKVGRFLRKTSIDELPQLFNILIGQMSFIGPRPALWNQLELINERKNNHVDLLRPGLSGWAQCNGRDDIDLKQKIALDTEYLHKFSIWFDIKIFFLSIERAIVGKDVIEGKQS